MYIHLHNAKRILSAITALSMCGVPISAHAMHNESHAHQGGHGTTISTNTQRSPSIDNAIGVHSLLNGNAIAYTYARTFGEWEPIRLSNGTYKCPAPECENRGDAHALKWTAIHTHINENHRTIREYQCARCGNLFLRRDTMKNHAQVCRYNTDETLHQRVKDFCNRHYFGGYYKRGEYAYEPKSLPYSYAEAKYRCPYPECQMSIRHASRMIDHINTYHKQTVEYICKGCTFTAATLGLIRDHIKSYASSTERGSLRTHLPESSSDASHAQTAHSGNAESAELLPVECGLEGQTYKDIYLICNNNLIVYSHYRDYGKQGPIYISNDRYVCPYENCRHRNINLSYVSMCKHITEKHNLSHTYQCARCRATFLKSETAKNHVSRCPYNINETLIRQIRDYQCMRTHTPECYTKSGYLIYDGFSLPRSPDNTTYTCPKCDKEFWCTQSALDHINTKHEQTLKYICNCCTFWSFSYTSIENHISRRVMKENQFHTYQGKLEAPTTKEFNSAHAQSTASHSALTHGPSTEVTTGARVEVNDPSARKRTSNNGDAAPRRKVRKTITMSELLN